MNTTFKIKWVQQPVAEMTLLDVADAEAVGSLKLKATTRNGLLLEILQARLRSASYRRSGGPIAAKLPDSELPENWGITSYEDLNFLMETYFTDDPWSFELIGKELPSVEEDEIEGMMMS